MTDYNDFQQIQAQKEPEKEPKRTPKHKINRGNKTVKRLKEQFPGKGVTIDTTRL